MTDNRLPQVRHDRVVDARVLNHRGQMPSWAYTRVGIGDLPLSGRIRDAIKTLERLVLPLVDNFEALQPQPKLCFICNRDLGGWPDAVLEDHWFAHSWLQRKLADRKIS